MPKILTWREFAQLLSDSRPLERLDDPAVVWVGAESYPITLIVTETPELGQGEERLVALPSEDVDAS